MPHRLRRKGNKQRTCRLAALAVIALLGVGACAEEPKQAPRPPQPLKPAAPPAQPAQPAPPAPKAEEKPQEGYTYNPGSRRDPFQPLIIKEEKKARTGVSPPLERYNITEFKLSGIFWGGFGYNAIFEGPDGKGYFLRVGTVVGPNQGVVKKITQNSILIEEKFKTAAGETQRKEIVVELRKKQEGTP